MALRALIADRVSARDDLWYGPETWPQGHRLCRRRLGGTPAYELLEPRGTLHNALIYWESQVALWNFLVRVAY